jgi:hypothetical protein
MRSGKARLVSKVVRIHASPCSAKSVSSRSRATSATPITRCWAARFGFTRCAEARTRGDAQKPHMLLAASFRPAQPAHRVSELTIRVWWSKPRAMACVLQSMWSTERAAWAAARTAQLPAHHMSRTWCGTACDSSRWHRRRRPCPPFARHGTPCTDVVHSARTAHRTPAHGRRR